MALHPNFPRSPYSALVPDQRWFPAAEDLSTYTPDFIVRIADGTVWIAETKGRAELDLPQKMARLSQWCADATAASRTEGGPDYRFVYVDQEGYQRNSPQTFAALAASFTEYQGT